MFATYPPADLRLIKTSNLASLFLNTKVISKETETNFRTQSCCHHRVSCNYCVHFPIHRLSNDTCT